MCVGVWTSHKDVIWQLVHHPTEGKLLSVSADGTVKIWKEFDRHELVDSIEKNSNDCLLGSFIYKSTSEKYIEIPTSASWMHTDYSTLLIGYKAPILGIFDKLTGKTKGVIKFEVDSEHSFTS